MSSLTKCIKQNDPVCAVCQPRASSVPLCHTHQPLLSPGMSWSTMTNQPKRAVAHGTCHAYPGQLSPCPFGELPPCPPVNCPPALQPLYVCIASVWNSNVCCCLGPCSLQVATAGSHDGAVGADRAVDSPGEPRPLNLTRY